MNRLQQAIWAAEFAWLDSGWKHLGMPFITIDHFIGQSIPSNLSCMAYYLTYAMIDCIEVPVNSDSDVMWRSKLAVQRIECAFERAYIIAGEKWWIE